MTEPNTDLPSTDVKDPAAAAKLLVKALGLGKPNLITAAKENLFRQDSDNMANVAQTICKNVTQAACALYSSDPRWAFVKNVLLNWQSKAAEKALDFVTKIPTIPEKALYHNLNVEGDKHYTRFESKMHKTLFLSTASIALWSAGGLGVAAQVLVGSALFAPKQKHKWLKAVGFSAAMGIAATGVDLAIVTPVYNQIAMPLHRVGLPQWRVNGAVKKLDKTCPTNQKCEEVIFSPNRNASYVWNKLSEERGANNAENPKVTAFRVVKEAAEIKPIESITLNGQSAPDTVDKVKVCTLYHYSAYQLSSVANTWTETLQVLKKPLQHQVCYVTNKKAMNP